MSAQEYNEIGRDAGEEIGAGAWLPALLAAGGAAVGRLPAFGAWWNQDDWGLLARAAGVIPAAEAPARWISRTAYWTVMSPLAGLDPHPYTATRLVLFGLAAAGVARLGARLGLRPHQQLIAGLLLACSPLAFTPLYWAAGIQELLALATAIWACERWLAGGPGARLAAGGLALVSFASKETFLGLPALWAAWSLSGAGQGRRRIRREEALILGVLALGAAVSAWLALRAFAGGAADPYARGGPLVALANLGLYGWYLLSPGPVYAPNVAPWMGAVGWAFWAAATAWSVVAWRRGRRRAGLRHGRGVAGDRARLAAGAASGSVPRPGFRGFRGPRRRRSGATAPDVARGGDARAGGGGRGLGHPGDAGASRPPRRRRPAGRPGGPAHGGIAPGGPAPASGGPGGEGRRRPGPAAAAGHQGGRVDGRRSRRELGHRLAPAPQPRGVARPSRAPRSRRARGLGQRPDELAGRGASSWSMPARF